MLNVNRLRIKQALVILVTLALLFGLGPSPGEATVSPLGPNTISELAEKVKSSVVNISTTKIIKRRRFPFPHPFGNRGPFRDFFGDDMFERFFGEQNPSRERESHSLGSGVIIESQGVVLTNSHVVEGADKIMVKLLSGKEYDAELMGRDQLTDLALLNLKGAEGLPVVPLGDSDRVKVGEWVIAIGNPFGLGHTVTAGIISAKGRVIGAGPYDNFLQTDAAINFGNSGGPLFNLKGEVIGINTAIVARGQNIGFAIPVNMAKELLPQLKAGKVLRGWLGVGIQPVTESLAKSLGIKTTQGALVSQVFDDGPARKAGLEPGDVIVVVGSKRIKDIHELIRHVGKLKPDEKVKVRVIRNGEKKNLFVVLGTRPEKVAKVEKKLENGGKVGLKLQDLTPGLARRFGLANRTYGALIVEVTPGSLAADADLMSGDLIVQVDRQVVMNVQAALRLLKKAEEKEVALLLIKRRNRTLFVGLQLKR